MTRLVLHVGLPKSGTTYLQARLVRNAAALAGHGVLVPLAARESGRGSLAFRAALDLTGRRMGRPAAYAAGGWERLVEAVATHPGTVVVSHEAFVRCREGQAARAVAELGRHHDVHVVLTARDPGRLAVSAWLEGLKHGTTHDLEEHLALAASERLPVWRTLDLAAVLDVWHDVLPPGRLHVVTVPPRGGDRALLWGRFCAAAGIPVDAAPGEPRRANESLGVPEAQAMLALNRRLGADAARGGRLHRPISRVVAPALAARVSVPVEVPPYAGAWAEGVARRWRDRLAHGVDVVGDPADLWPAPVDPAAWVDPAAPHPGRAAVETEVSTLLEASIRETGSTPVA